MRIVIIGGGLAAATAAAELRGRGFDGEVVVFAAEQHLPYERPPLSKGILQGKEEFAAAMVHDAAWYDTHHVDLRVGVSVTAIDPSRRTVIASGDTTTTYDRLLLAPGAEPRRFALAEQVGAPAYLRTIEDSERLRSQLRPGQQVVIVGGGWIGLEVAAAARIAGANVTVFEAGELPLIRVLGPEIAQVFADLHRYHGVDLRLSSQVSEADLTDADVVVVGIGAIPRTALAEAAGLAVDNGIVVDEHLRTSAPDVFAAGDVDGPFHIDTVVAVGADVSEVLHAQVVLIGEEVGLPHVLFRASEQVACHDFALLYGGIPMLYPDPAPEHRVEVVRHISDGVDLGI
jgi:3-phenylpropionate/trans-cinnamate dioxygenase ferredoxin reductase subunit